MSKFRVTYEIVTPESAEHGDVAARGFIFFDGWRVDIGDVDTFTGVLEMNLRDALQLCSPSENCGAWFSETDSREDYRTGAVETRALHPPRNITAASYVRLARLLGC